jgi:acyl-CoA thioesterase I
MVPAMRSLLVLVVTTIAVQPWLQGADPAAQTIPPSQANQRVVVLGDSLAAGYGVGAGESWPDRLQSRIREAGLPFTVVNAGVSGDTTAGGLRRIDWILKQPVDVLVLELGGNDGLRGMAPTATRTNLVGIIQKTRTKWPTASIVLAGMQMPASMGRDFSEKFGRVFPEVAQSERLHLIPHLLEGVGGVPELNLPDLIHPTPAGHDLVASNAWKTIEPVLRQRLLK